MSSIAYSQYKNRLLLMSLAIDFMGMLSYLFPIAGEWTDIATSLLTALAIFRGYHSVGWAAFGFFEEILPFTDIIPSATIVWFYRFVLNNRRTFNRFITEKGAA
jgi:hypothetical protein